VQAWNPGLGYGLAFEVSRYAFLVNSSRKLVPRLKWLRMMILNDIIFGESWNEGVKLWVFVQNQIPTVFPHEVIEGMSGPLISLRSSRFALSKVMLIIFRL
jgi:hypothetical protein